LKTSSNESAGHFDYFNESVQYEFGYGLSYTTFSMSSATVTRVASGSSISAAPANNTVAPGGNPALWDVLYTVSVSVSNTGSVAGATVPQLYLGLPQPANEVSEPHLSSPPHSQKQEEERKTDS